MASHEFYRSLTPSILTPQNTKAHDRPSRKTVIPVRILLRCIWCRREETLSAEQADLYLWKNADGPYYAINPFPDAQGKRNGLQIYLQTDMNNYPGVKRGPVQGN